MTTQQLSRFHTALNCLFEANRGAVRSRAKCRVGTLLFPAWLGAVRIPTKAATYSNLIAATIPI